jgi:hypothetical protein
MRYLANYKYKIQPEFKGFGETYDDPNSAFYATYKHARNTKESSDFTSTVLQSVLIIYLNIINSDFVA